MTNIDKPDLYAEIIQTEHEVDRIQAIYSALDAYTDCYQTIDYFNMLGIVGADLERAKSKLTKLKFKRYGKQRH